MFHFGVWTGPQMEDFIVLFILSEVSSDSSKRFEERIWVKYDSLHSFVDELIFLSHV